MFVLLIDHKDKKRWAIEYASKKNSCQLRDTFPCLALVRVSRVRSCLFRNVQSMVSIERMDCRRLE